MIREATSKLTEDEKRDIIESLPRWASPEPSFTPDFAKRPRISQQRLISLLARVDLAAIRRAGRKLAIAVESQLPELRKNADAVKDPVNFQVHGVIVELSRKDGRARTSTRRQSLHRFRRRQHLHAADMARVSVMRPSS